ncbi:hypothetical protein D3C85_278180 [compost metagenome]
MKMIGIAAIGRYPMRLRDMSGGRRMAATARAAARGLAQPRSPLAAPMSNRGQAAHGALFSGSSHAAGAPFRVKLFAYDDSLFIDDAYVIKGVPGRLLFHFLRLYAESGRCDFTNREVRLESALRLPDLKDNLETRLILLRRRLEERQTPVRLSRPGRGQIRLEVEGSPRLELIADN